jgi:hypothetical protein
MSRVEFNSKHLALFIPASVDDQPLSRQLYYL